MTAPPISLEQQIACVRREIGMRARVYPRWTSAGKMTTDEADRELNTMRAVLATLERLAKAQQPQGGLFNG